MRSTAPFSDRLIAALQPAEKLDRFDELAIDIINVAQTAPFKDARKLIAAMLRLQHTEAVLAGAEGSFQEMLESLPKSGVGS